MSFGAAVEHLHSLGMELAPQPSGSAPRRKFDLDHMRTLVRALGDPQLRFPAILIAGTNGKGSTAATLASIMKAAGYRTGLYTSPHLSQVTERIRTAEPGMPFTDIPEDDFARLYFQVDDAGTSLVAAGALPQPPSFFEALTALAFLFFAERQLDIAILEVGLGGRLDATNVVEPILSVITDIALDHQEYLGNTIDAIAREKAGILRQDGILVTLPQHPEANQAIGEVAVALNVRGVNAANYLPDRNSSETSSSNTTSQNDRNHYLLNVDGETLTIDSPLLGEHQRRNIALAIAAAITIRNRYGHKSDESTSKRNNDSYKITNTAIQKGIADTIWPGRLEFLTPDLVLDVAHNPAGAWTLRAMIAALPDHRPRTLIFSCLRDKDLKEMAQILFPLFDATGGRPHDHIVLTQIDNPRAAPLADLEAVARHLDVPFQSAADPSEALTLAHSLTPTGGLVMATGSVYLIGTLRELALAQDQPVQPQ